jgi:hypothetical protein
MPQRKAISKTGIVGQRGINLIERLVLQMGSRWTPSGPNEVRIDGYIELFDPDDGRPLNLTLAVQSKVDSRLPKKNAVFYYWCNREDIENWLRSSLPVILVVSSPSSDEAYWVSIADYFGHRGRDSTRVAFAKTENALTRASFGQLVQAAEQARTQRPSSVAAEDGPRGPSRENILCRIVNRVFDLANIRSLTALLDEGPVDVDFSGRADYDLNPYGEQPVQLLYEPRFPYSDHWRHNKRLDDGYWVDFGNYTNGSAYGYWMILADRPVEFRLSRSEPPPKGSDGRIQVSRIVSAADASPAVITIVIDISGATSVLRIKRYLTIAREIFRKDDQRWSESRGEK